MSKSISQSFALRIESSEQPCFGVHLTASSPDPDIYFQPKFDLSLMHKWRRKFKKITHATLWSRPNVPKLTTSNLLQLKTRPYVQKTYQAEFGAMAGTYCLAWDFATGVS